MIKRLFILLLLCICINTYSQISYVNTGQAWTRIQLEYKKDNTLISQHIEHRYDFINGNKLLQTRFQAISCGEGDIHAGGGVTLRLNEFRLHQIAVYDIHTIRLEQRFFSNFTLLRFRYMLYPQFKINETNKINVGIEMMVQGAIGKEFVPSETRFMLDYSQVNGGTTITAGYMASVFQTYIIHSLRVTVLLHYGDK